MEKKTLERRSFICLGLTTVAAGSGILIKRQALAGTPAKSKTDGTPLQFSPKNGPDANPAENDIAKYPKCPYCGMDRKQWNHSRYLIHYGDDMVDPTCSLHCVAVSLSLNLDRFPKAIYVADFGSDQEIKPLIDAEKASYLVGSKLKGTMTMQSKMAFSSKSEAETALKQKGGEIGDFDFALTQAYLSMAKDTIMIRKKRAERKKRQMKRS